MSTYRARREVVGLGAVAGLLNVNFLLERLLPHATPVASTVISDLASPGRPWSWAFRVGDLLSGLVLLVLCGVAWRVRPAASSRAWRFAVIALAVFATSTVVAVVVPERCPAQGGCGGSLEAAPLTDVVHDVISTGGTTCGLLAALALALATRRTLTHALGHLAAFVLGGALGIAFLVAQALGGTAWLGWTQRGQVVVLSAWFALVGWSVAAARPAPTMPP